MKQSFFLIAVLAAGPSFAEDRRELGAHEHGTGTLNIAIDGQTVVMELEVPGADIVGFEHPPHDADDRAAVDMAVAQLAKPQELFVLPAGAACSITQASAELEIEGAHDDHDDHEAHSDHEEHAGHDEHDAHHDDEAHGGHGEEATHSEFHAEYTLDCGHPEALTDVTFAYFDAFANAQRLQVQIVTSGGAQAVNVDRDAPALDLRTLF